MSDEQVEWDPGRSSRRRVLTGAGMIGAGAGAAVILGACGTDPNSNFEVPPPPGSPGLPSDTPPDSAPPATEAPEDTDDDPPPQGIAATSDVEVGGGLIVAEEDLVITQPAAGEWKGFSATCTHQGCALSSISNGTINCDCHGSQFSIQDGSVVTAAYGGDPSQQNPLPEVAIAIEGDQILRA